MNEKRMLATKPPSAEQITPTIRAHSGAKPGIRWSRRAEASRCSS